MKNACGLALFMRKNAAGVSAAEVLRAANDRESTIQIVLDKGAALAVLSTTWYTGNERTCACLWVNDSANDAGAEV